MTKTPVKGLILSLAVPTTISMMVTNFYNMADTYFVSSLGTSASGATGIVFALMAVIQAFGFLFGHGAGSSLSRQLGKQEKEQARVYSATGFWLAVLCGVLIMMCGLWLQTPMLKLLGSTDSIFPYARDYSRWILLAAPAMAAGCVLNNILRYEGKAILAMAGLISGAVLNVFGDYLLIRVWNLGTTGAGISTAVSQYISVAVLAFPFLRKKVQSSLSVRYVTRDMGLIFGMISVGLPSMMCQALNSVSVMAMNHCCARYGDTVLAAMSITARVTNFLFCIAIGIGQGFQPVCGFNYGAKKYKRVKEACRFTCMFSIRILSVLAVLGFLFANPVVGFFRDDPEVIQVGAYALQAHCISLVFMPVSLCGNMLFQSVGKSIRADFLAAARSGLFYVPVLFVMSRWLGLGGIQISQSVADILAAVAAFPMIRTFLQSLPEDG